jgi:hypothetical protein
MKQFTSLDDVASAGLPLPLKTLLEHLLKIELALAGTGLLDPSDGAIYLLEEDDSDQVLMEQFSHRFADLPYEGIQYLPIADAYVCRFLRDNQCCISLVLPNWRWIPESWQATIKEEMS